LEPHQRRVWLGPSVSNAEKIQYTKDYHPEVIAVARRTFFVVLLLLLLTVPILSAELPQVLQPNTTSYSPTEVATLKQKIATLNGILSDTDLGSRRLFAGNGWQSRNFAEYTGGSLSELGYVVQLVSQAGWSNGVHTWVVVGLPLAGKTAWVPVEASPEYNQVQQNLGYVPSYSDSGGNLWFEARYLNFSGVEDLPRNVAPVASIRLPASHIDPRKTEKFIALGSYDPDGEIVLYKWNLGDGTFTIRTTPVVRHAYDKGGTYLVSLSVVDNRGKMTTATSPVHVGKRESEPREADTGTGGCGCSK